MADRENTAESVLNGETGIIDYICGIAAVDAQADRDRPNDLPYWESVRDAHKNGKKLIFVNGPAPNELLYALGCVPLYLDMAFQRLSGDGDLASKLIDMAEMKENPTLCSLQKEGVGALISEKLGVSPDAYVTVPIPCDSARAAYGEAGRFIGAPAFHFDIPMRSDEKSLRYVGMQLKMLAGFLEGISGKKLDRDAVKYRMELYNRSAKLLSECALLRRSVPCPLSSRAVAWNEMMNAFAQTEMMPELLASEISLCKSRIAAGTGPCPEGEKHRVLLIHNLLRRGMDISSWLESEYGAVTVADGFLFDTRERFPDGGGSDACIDLMCRRLLSGSMTHGAGVSGLELLNSIGGAIGDYSPDVFIFLGSRGCRHAWAAAKMVEDAVREKFASPMLTLDIDNTDFRYKSMGEIKNLISEYMDTVVNRQ